MIDHPKHSSVNKKSLEHVFMHMHLHILNLYGATSVKLHYANIQTQKISNTVTGDAVKHPSKKDSSILVKKNAVGHENRTSYGSLFYFLTQNTSSDTIVKKKVQVSNYNQCIHAIILYEQNTKTKNLLFLLKIASYCSDSVP